MKSFLAIALATTALVATSPSFAQSPDDTLRGLRSLLGHPPGDQGERDLYEQEHHLNDLIEQSAAQGRIDHRQADHALDELRSIRGEQDDLRARNGGRLAHEDHDRLQDRLAHLDHEVDAMREGAGPEHHDFDRHDHGDFWDRAPAELDQREDWLDHRIHDGIADGSLDREEGHRALEQLREIRLTESDMARHDGGYLSDRHRAELSERLDDLGRQLHWARERRD